LILFLSLILTLTLSEVAACSPFPDFREGERGDIPTHPCNFFAMPMRSEFDFDFDFDSDFDFGAPSVSARLTCKQASWVTWNRSKN
jgi:hypothetical protein